MLKILKYSVFFSVIFSFLNFNDLIAQTLGNEWIVSGQSYYKIPVAKTGTYAISGAELINAGLPSGTIDPRKLQLWHRGVEQSILVKGETDGVLDATDSLFFYGEMNDGTLDSLLYLTPALQPHKYYNLYTDTAAYFLTWAVNNGKRMKLLNYSTSQIPVTYHLDETLTLFTDTYDMGREYGESHLSEFDQGEGWFSDYFNGTSSYNLNAKNLYLAGSWPKLEVQVVGRNQATTHIVTISLGDPANPDTVFALPGFNEHEIYTLKGLINPAFFSASGNLKVNVVANTNQDLVSLAYMKLTYPQTMDMYHAVEKYFTLPPYLQDTSYLQISNPTPGSLVLDITNKDSIRMIQPVFQGGLLKLVVPGTLSGRKLFVTSNYLSVPAILSSNLSAYSPSSGFIIVTHTKLLTGSRAFAAYRASLAGGGYDTLVADVNRLYDLFTYGERTPLAIRRFAKFLLNNGSPQYLFLIGKAVGVNLSQFGVYYRKDPNFLRNKPDNSMGFTIDDLVPTAGYPASDILFTAGLDNIPGHQYHPAIKTGRLAARDNATITNYLGKVMEHESLDSNLLWRKNFIHISGGDDAGQVILFKSYVNSYKAIAEGPLFGGKVLKTFTKESNNSVDDSFKQSVAQEVNKGLSYITFFGHSSPVFTDVDLGFVSTDFLGYQNKGKYPFLFANGCYSANIFNYYSYLEDWVITPDRGAIAALGHTDLGYTDLLESYDRSFYQTAFTNSKYITKSIGVIQSQVLNIFADSTSITQNTLQPGRKAGALQMLLHGDPSIKIYGPSRNDYSIVSPNNDQQVYIKAYGNGPITAVSDSFAIGIVVSNFGQATQADSFAITISRSVNNINTVVYGPVMYPVIYYKDTIFFTIKSKDPKTYGENSFIVKIDALDAIQEMREDNNTVVFNYFIPLSGVTALLPKEYSIINSSYLSAVNQIKLVAQSTDLLIGSSTYYFEMDTSHHYNSPLKVFTTVNSNSLATWNTSLKSLVDSTVYYWRVRLDPVPAGMDTIWGESSFIYIAGSSEGWSQSEYPQFNKDNVSQIELNVEGKTWEFPVSTESIHVRSVGSNYPPNPNLGNWTPMYETEISYKNTELFYHDKGVDNCYRGLLAMAIDKHSGVPYIPASTAPDIGFTCGGVRILENFRVLYDSSGTASAGSDNQAALISYLDAVNPGDYVMLCNNGEIFGSVWSQALKDKMFSALGARLVDSLVNGRPYLILAVKGNYTSGTAPLPIIERFNNDSSSVLMDTTIFIQANTGTITSTLIGPAAQWDSLFKDIRLPDAGDGYNLKLIKIKQDGTQVIEPINPFSISYDLSSIDPLIYPYLRLEATVYDSVNLTPPQLERWQIVYKGVPEGTMSPEATNNMAQYNFFTKAEGQPTKLTFAFTNIYKIDFPDSIKVKFTITNESGRTMTEYITLPPLKKDSTLTFNYSINTLGFYGKNVFQAFVNPKLQPEQNYDNNIIEIPFTIENDKTSPVLDVVFDGQHIMNGDVVSPSPLISIMLNDENKYLIKNDTVGMLVFLQRPGDQFPQKINLSDLNVTYGQESGNNNSFKIEYHPKNLPDGIYTLVVQGADVSGNKSGSQYYRITFEVINEVAISYFYPYPNPFSTSTRFVFTLTGNEIPEDMKIQIMTVTGKVVREIMKNEIGPIKIGNNKTEYAWDGTDEFGDKLANGVYLYRVIIKGADDFKHKQTAGDKNFKKDWGKMYILR